MGDLVWVRNFLPKPLEKEFFSPTHNSKRFFFPVFYSKRYFFSSFFIPLKSVCNLFF